MALTKRTYVDGETIITAQNLNDIQDEIISHANTFVPKTRTINSKALDANITLTASDLSAVPTTRTVNSKALSSNITLTAADVGAVPTTRTVNSKALSSNITLTSDDIGYNSSTTYTSGTVGKAVSDLNGAITSKQDSITILSTEPSNTTCANSVSTTLASFALTKGTWIIICSHDWAASINAGYVDNIIDVTNSKVLATLRNNSQLNGGGASLSAFVTLTGSATITYSTYNADSETRTARNIHAIAFKIA